MLGGLASGSTVIENLLEGADCLATAAILRQLGVTVERAAEGRWRVDGGALREPTTILDCGNSGTTMRLMAGILAGQPFHSVLSGDESLNSRPMPRVGNPLRQMGATIDGREDGKFAPLSIRGGRLHGIDTKTPVASAQIKSSILLAGLFADGETTVTEPSLSRDHTERMLPAFGVTLEQKGLSATVQGGAKLQAGFIQIPADFSSAAFPLVAALVIPDSRLELVDVGTNWTRVGFLDLLQSSGANIQREKERERAGEPAADLTAQTSSLTAMTAGGDLIPRMIDEVPLFAVAATQSHGETRLSEAGELRLKESDRLETIRMELGRMGAAIETTEDGLIIQGPTFLTGAIVHSHGDHRIAMSLAIAGMIADGETLVTDVECVDTSFPGFVQLMRALGADIEEV